MRLFVEIDLPEEVKKELRRVQSQAASWKDIRMSKTRDFHMTLKFLGECSEQRKSRVIRELSQIPFRSFEGSLTNMGTFGGNQPRVLWVGVEVPPWFDDVMAEIEKCMQHLGFERENDFFPHVTLARMKFVQKPKEFLQMVQHLEVKPLPFMVKDFFLFESKLSSQGAIHTKLHTFPARVFT